MINVTPALSMATSVPVPMAIPTLAWAKTRASLGFSLDEIRTLLRLVDGKRYTCQEVKSIMDNHLQDIKKKKISDLRRLQKTLGEISSRCEGGKVPDCPIIDTLFSDKRIGALREPRGMVSVE